MIEIIEEKVRKPKKTEDRILELLKEKNNEISFYQLYKELTEEDEITKQCKLKITSGGLHSALKRMAKKNKIFIKKRVKRFETLIWYKNFDTDPLIDLEDQNEIIFPFRMNRTIGLILQEIPELTSEYNNLTDMIKEAILFFFRNKISDEIRKKAFNQAVKKGKIPKNLVNLI